MNDSNTLMEIFKKEQGSLEPESRLLKAKLACLLEKLSSQKVALMFVIHDKHQLARALENHVFDLLKEVREYCLNGKYLN
jgi:hypothetical protein